MNDKVAIIGISSISDYGYNISHIIENKKSSKGSSLDSKVWNWHLVPKNRLRRTNFFTKMCLKCVEDVIMSSRLSTEDIIGTQTGTISNTSYGTLTQNIEFAEQVALGDPDIVSPTTFASTVTNSALGHVCIAFDLRGDSTSLLSSNIVKYGLNILKNGHVNRLIMVGVEEYNDIISKEFNEINNVDIEIGNAASAVLLSNNDKDTNVMGYIVDSKTISIPGNLYSCKISENDIEDITLFLEGFKDYYDFDMVISSSLSNSIISIEKSIFGVETEYVDFHEYYDEIFGATQLSLIALGCKFFSDKVRTICLISSDVTGNYSATIIENK